MLPFHAVRIHLIKEFETNQATSTRRNGLDFPNFPGWHVQSGCFIQTVYTDTQLVSSRWADSFPLRLHAFRDENSCQ